jgi:hypothetical protein
LPKGSVRIGKGHLRVAFFMSTMRRGRGSERPGLVAHRSSYRLAVLATAGSVLLGACQSVQAPVTPEPAAPNWTTGWEPFALPGKRATRYLPQAEDAHWVLLAKSERSASMFRKTLRLEPERLGTVVFSWKVDELIEGADVRQNDSEDAPVRVLLAFDGDHTRLSPRTRLLFDLLHSLSGETPPYATLMYVWDNQADIDTLVVNRRSDRVRKIVLESGPANLGQWRSYRRDIRADFRRAFGEDPGPLIGIAVMTDSDNTQSHAEAWYGEIRLE